MLSAIAVQNSARNVNNGNIQIDRIFLSYSRTISFVNDMTMDEAGLLKTARKGDEMAFLALYQRHRYPVYRFAYRLTSSTVTAEDITQECFMVLLKGARLKGNNIKAYLFGIVRHLSIKHQRLSKREADLSADIAGPGDPSGELIKGERASFVEQAVRSLPLLQRESLVLFEYEDLSLEEIAAITGATVGMVKARLLRARESLRQKLAPLLRQCHERRCS